MAERQTVLNSIANGQQDPGETTDARDVFEAQCFDGQELWKLWLRLVEYISVGNDDICMSSMPQRAGRPDPRFSHNSEEKYI